MTKVKKEEDDEEEGEESGETSYYDTEEDDNDIPAMPKTDESELYPSDSSFMKDMQLLKNLQALKDSIEPKMMVELDWI